MKRYIDPTYDTGFKLLFGRENISNVLLIDFLNAILEKDSSISEITSISYLNNEHEAEWMGGKGIRYDILCETSDGHRFIVEMQKASQPNFIDRATFYVSRGIAEQGYKGHDEDDTIWDYSLKPVIGVFICNFHVPSIDEKVISRFRVMDEETHKPMGDLTRYIFIQLPFFTKKENQCENIIDQWIYNLKYMGSNQEVAFRNHSEIFKRLAKISNVATLTPDERYSYDADVKNARDLINQFRGARQEGLAEGRAEGHAEGLAEGRAEGRAEGIAEGRAEGIAEEKVHIAGNLIRLGLSDTDIAAATGLTNQQIETIRDSIK